MRRSCRGKRGKRVCDGVGTDPEQFVCSQLRGFSLYQDPKQRCWPLP